MPKGQCLLLSAKHITTEEAKRIGEALIVDWSKFDVEQFRMGLDVELEHGISDLQTNVTHPDEIAKLITLLGVRFHLPLHCLDISQRSMRQVPGFRS